MTEEGIKGLSIEWMNAWINKDAEAINRLLADDFTLTSSRSKGELTRKEEWIKNALSFTSCEEFNYDFLEIKFYGITSVVKSITTQKASIDGKDWSGTFILTDIWVEREGKWQVVSRHASRPAI